METKTHLCAELILDDVIGVSLCECKTGVFSRPATVMSCDIEIVAPFVEIAKFHVSDPDVVATMSQAPALSISSERTDQGGMYTHELSIYVSDNLSQVEKVIDSLQYMDFFVLYHKADGSRAISYPLPNTTGALVEESTPSANSSIARIKMLSMSGLIRVLA